MKQSNSLLLIFVKHPEAGKSKTRLAKGIGHEKALDVYRELLTFTCNLVQGLAIDKAVYYGNEMPEHDLWRAAKFARFQQQGATLGDRMEHAFQWGFEQGYSHISIIGSDCATLSQEILRDAFQSLTDKDYVLGPATDGGYYLLGMNKLDASPFHNKNWSTDSVLRDTLADITSSHKSYHLLPTLSDVDVVDDLKGTFLESYMQFAT